MYTTDKFRYPINDVILKRGKELVKTVLVTLPAESPLLKSLQNQQHVQSQNYSRGSYSINLL